MDWIQNRIKQLESQLANPDVLDQKKVETKLEAYREIFSAAKCGALGLAHVGSTCDHPEESRHGTGYLECQHCMECGKEI